MDGKAVPPLSIDLEGAGLAGEEGLDGSADQFAEAEDSGIGDVVDHAGTVTAASQDARLGEGLEMSGGVGLGQPGRLHQGRDRQLAALEGTDELQPIGLSEDPESGGDQFQGVIADLGTGAGSQGLALGHVGSLHRWESVINNMSKNSWMIPDTVVIATGRDRAAAVQGVGGPEKSLAPSPRRGLDGLPEC